MNGKEKLYIWLSGKTLTSTGRQIDKMGLVICSVGIILYSCSVNHQQCRHQCDNLVISGSQSKGYFLYIYTYIQYYI